MVSLELQLLRVFIDNRQIYDQYREAVDVDLFENKPVRRLYTALDDLYKTVTGSTSVIALGAYLNATTTNSGTDTEAAELLAILDAAGIDEASQPTIADAIIKRQTVYEIAKRCVTAAGSGVLLGDGFDSLTTYIRERLDRHDKTASVEEDGSDFVEGTLRELVESSYRKHGLRWRLASLNTTLGSLRVGDFGFLFARPECISGDSMIRVKYHKDATSSRTYKMSDLYRMFNGKHHLKGMGHQVQSCTPDGRVYYNDIEHVTYSGKKAVLEVVTGRGFRIKATEDHEFLMPDGTYKRLGSLQVGDYLRTDRTQRQTRRTRAEMTGVWPGSPYTTKMVGNYGPYHRAKVHRLVYDASLNGLDLTTFRQALVDGHANQLRFSDPTKDIHHIDMDHYNNDPANLLLVSREEHTALHAKSRDVGNSSFADPDQITSITLIGTEDVYDLGVSGPHKNFRANGVFVHNCGKTTFLTDQVSFMSSQVPDVYGEDRVILHFNNEEQGPKVRLRYIQATLGLPLSEIMRDLDGYYRQYVDLTGDRIKIIDSPSITKAQVERLCKKYKPALIIFDQLDKVGGFEADREDLRLGGIYQWAREIAKAYCPVIAVSQADGTGEGVKWLTMAHVANAKTAKQAEADWILGIGKQNKEGYESCRYLNISKNKLLGDDDSDPALRHGKIEVIIRPELARYADI